MLEINGVQQVNKDKEYIEVYLDILFDKDTSIRWELENPQVLVGFSKNDEKYINYLELINNGMSVHAFEFTDPQRKEIMDYVKKIDVNKE